MNLLPDEAGKPVNTVPEPRRCIAYGRGLAGGPAGSSLSFTLSTIANDGRKLTVGGNYVSMFIAPVGWPAGLKQTKAAINVIDNLDGSYLCTYSVNDPDDYSLYVRVAGHDVSGSPFKVTITPGAPAASASSVMVVENPLSSDIGHTEELRITSCDVFGNKTYSPSTKVGCRGSGGVKVVDVVDFQDGMYTVSFTVNGEGRLDVLLDGQHVLNSPITVLVPPPVEYPRVQERDTLRERELRLLEREDDLTAAYGRLDRLKGDLNTKATHLFEIDPKPTVPPIAAEAVISQNFESERSRVIENMVNEMERKFAVLKAKETELDKLIVQVNEQKLNEEAEELGLKHVGVATSTADLRRVEAAYSRRDPYVEERKEQLQKLLARRTREKEVGIDRDSKTTFDLSEAIKRAAFLTTSQKHTQAQMDADSKVLFCLDFAFNRFCTASENEAPALSLSDAVRLANVANLPLDNSEVVDAYIAFIGTLPDMRFVSRNFFAHLLLELARLSYRGYDITDTEMLAKMLRDHLFPICHLVEKPGDCH